MTSDEQVQFSTRARAAAQRWSSRSVQREHKRQAVRDRRYTQADSVDRLAKWARRRRTWFDVLTGDDAAGPVTAGGQRPLTRQDVTDELIERVTGRTRDLLSIEFFELGLLAARCVGRVVTRGEPNGSGFLVAPGLLLTNQHVLPSTVEAAASLLELDYEENRVGPERAVEEFHLAPQRFFLADERLDFALVAVDLVSTRGSHLDSFRILPLIDEEGKIRIGEPVNIIQHPGGRVKQVVIRNNQLVDLPEEPASDAFFHYEADTEKGSSGSPVFNDLWEVVAVHHTGVPKTDDQGRLVDQNDDPLPDDADPSRFVWVANEGVRVSRIVAAVREAHLSPDMHRVRVAALQAWQVRGEPAVAERLADAARGVVDPRTAPPRARGGRPAGDPVRPDGRDEAVFLDVTVPVRVRVSLAGPVQLSQDPSVER